MAETETEIAMNRVVMALVGGVAGLAAWYFTELAGEMFQNPRVWLFLLTGVMGFFAILLGLVGPLSWARAVTGAAGLALLSAVLMLWGSLRFADLDGFFDTPHPVIALFLLLFIGTPFVSAGLMRKGGARDYALLFDTAWGLLVRYLAGWLFVAVVWGIVYLSDALLSLVGLTVIGAVLEIDPVPFALTGLFLGLAMAIMHELRAYISPFLVLRLFRILLPVLTLVVAVFLIALPLRGFGSLFGGLSVAATLMAVAIAALTLITSALDRTEAEEVTAPVMRGAARLMAGLLVPLCLAAGWAVWQRVGVFGWTPDRVAAALAAFVLVVYGLGYGVAALRDGWAGRIRALNPPLALGVVALAALWLTPVLNAEALSARSQVARFEEGRMQADALPLWEMKDAWGKPGAAGLAQLATLAETRGDADLSARLERLATADSRYAFEKEDRNAPPDESVFNAVLATLPVYPEGVTVTRAELAGLPREALIDLQRACATEVPGCALILADLDPHQPGEEGILLTREGSGDRVRVDKLHREGGAMEMRGRVYDDLTGTQLQQQGAALLQALEAGDIRIEPSGMQMISLGGINIIP